MMANVTLFVLLLLAVVSTTYAHTLVTAVSTPAAGVTNSCLRSIYTNSPISSVYAADMMCGWNPQGSTGAASRCSINAGEWVGVQWTMFDRSHKGPILVYMSANNGQSWFKVWEYGWDANKQKFASDVLLDNNGAMGVRVPADLAPGYYLMRAEIIALHAAYNIGGSQPYIACLELNVNGAGSTIPPHNAVFPGSYKDTDPGILINIYWPAITSYTTPGPAPYVPAYGLTSTDRGGFDKSFSTLPALQTQPEEEFQPPTSTNAHVTALSPVMSAVVAGCATVFIVLVVVGLATVHYKRTGQVFGYYLSKQPAVKNVGANYVAFVERA